MPGDEILDPRPVRARFGAVPPRVSPGSRHRTRSRRPGGRHRGIRRLPGDRRQATGDGRRANARRARRTRPAAELPQRAKAAVPVPSRSRSPTLPSRTSRSRSQVRRCGSGREGARDGARGGPRRSSAFPCRPWRSTGVNMRRRVCGAVRGGYHQFGPPAGRTRYRARGRARRATQLSRASRTMRPCRSPGSVAAPGPPTTRASPAARPVPRLANRRGSRVRRAGRGSARIPRTTQKVKAARPCAGSATAPGTST